MSPTEFSARRDRVRALLPKLKVDALLVTFLPNVRYLSGFTGSNAILVITESADRLLTDPRYDIQARAETSCDVRVFRKSLWTCIRQPLQRFRRIGFDSPHVSHAALATAQSTVGKTHRWIATSSVVEDLRMVKSLSEIELIRHSVDLNSRAFDEALAQFRHGMTEADLAAEIDYRQRRLGAQAFAFETIVASGVRTALPHARPGANPIARDALLLIDMGALYQGYSSDMTRVVFTGRPSRRARELYSAVLESQMAAVAAIRPGEKAANIDKTARQSLKQRGFDKFFTHSTGHGLGLEIHEAPSLRRKDKSVLQPGMVITVEPGVYLEDEGGIRIEDTVLVTDQGHEVLTPTSKQFLEI
ncbi:MAG: Xaa-Pro peptidase family protein [Bryobacteraceae bacterium]